jgi:hypothetical protein
MKTIILIISICGMNLFMSCCSTLFPDEKLSLQRTNYTGTELRTDGYYYYFVPEQNRTVVYFLYRNGIILWYSTYPTYNIKDIEKEIIKEKAKSKDHWGLFAVNSNTIQYEMWIEASSGIRATINRCSGYIESDTTIHFTESYNLERDETKQIDEVWHFKQFANKPDSTNIYIK